GPLYEKTHDIFYAVFLKLQLQNHNGSKKYQVLVLSDDLMFLGNQVNDLLTVAQDILIQFLDINFHIYIYHSMDTMYVHLQ
ncbi:10992_t:CDS:1, partial [Funneliformis geosporum]